MKVSPSTAWAQAHPALHRARCRQYQRTFRQKVRDLILDAKRRPCVDCGIELPPECMDLDHVRGSKDFDLGSGAKGARARPGMSRRNVIRAEIAKCDVRCPNCHRLRHFADVRDA